MRAALEQSHGSNPIRVSIDMWGAKNSVGYADYATFRHFSHAAVVGFDGTDAVQAQLPKGAGDAAFQSVMQTLAFILGRVSRRLGCYAVLENVKRMEKPFAELHQSVAAAAQSKFPWSIYELPPRCWSRCLEYI